MRSLFITNQHGSLIYYKNLYGRDVFSSNEIIRLASTLHGLSTIAPKLCIPKVNDQKALVSLPKGITFIESGAFRLQAFESLTGLCIFMICTSEGPSREHVNVILSYVYELYCDFVQKCPFHQPDMPVRSELFDENISKYFADLM
ncbi:bifunctional Trafficking protein particle complex subunit/Longin-like domain superfamily [Babesia duncani]|uniref:Trafficking protein particle complex subunit n=1 Tax=Babesia duncani TaxID=323732 RepID=A0AAD9PLB1_9APIC|nr:bifunctional Trafficking protein particle complex subunit/Longin-like domain superfamily [Babesia duncani]